jgi:hypothetical protein
MSSPPNMLQSRAIRSREFENIMVLAWRSLGMEVGMGVAGIFRDEASDHKKT